MKKIYLLLTLLITTSVAFGQIEIFNYGQEATMPAGWVGTNQGGNDIERGTYLLVESGDPSDIIDTAVYDLAGAASAEITLDVASFGSGTHNAAKIEISYDGGSTYTQTETSAATTGSSYIDGGTFALSSFTNQVKIRITNSGATGRGVRLRNIVLTAYTSDPIVTIDSPADFSAFSSGTTNVDIVFSTLNTNAGDYVEISLSVNGGGSSVQSPSPATSPFGITTTDGNGYSVTATLYDSGDVQLDFETIAFEVLFPCDLSVDAISTSCDAETAGIDTFTTSIDFTGGGSSTYTITTEGSVGVVGGDDPSAMAAGTIIITGVDEQTDFEVYIVGDAGDSSCNLTEYISGPTCIPSTCVNAGDIIITEIMNNATGSDTDKEFFEVYNTTGSAIDMIGWTISDADSDSHTITATLSVPANGYAVLGMSSDTGANGGVTVDYVYSGITLANGADEIILTCSPTIIDEVYYDGGPNFPDPDGASMELAENQYDSTANDNGVNWGTSTGGPLTSGDNGTPGATNSITSLSVARNEIEGFSVYPNPVNSGQFTIRSASHVNMDVSIYDMLGKQVYAKQVQSDETIQVSNLTQGIYILRVEEDGKLATRKLIIE